MNQSGDLTWRDGQIPVSSRFDDPYYSLDDGLAETQHVFLGGNDLPNRFFPGFAVAELGFGTGLNLLALAQCAEEAGAEHITYTGFEAFPMQRDEAERALKPFDMPGTETLLDAWTPLGFSLTLGPVQADILIGDARKTVPDWQGLADAWFLDGFAPAKNPELWEADLMAHVAAHTNPGGSFATYSAAGAVRRALSEAGFTVTRIPGFGRKRHMSTGIKPA